MAQPVHFFHFFVINPQFRQSVFDAGLTFHPDTDPTNPVLVNLNSTRFGMAEKITPLSPPAADNRNDLHQSTAPTQPLSSPLDVPQPAERSPLPILQPLPPPHSPILPFLSPNLFDLPKPVNITSQNGEPLGLEHYVNVAHPAELEGLISPNQDLNLRLWDDAMLARQFHDGLRIEMSDSESERLSEADTTLTNGGRAHLHHVTNIPQYEMYMSPSERRRAGRRRVVSRILDIRIPASPVCKRITDRAQAELVQQIEEIFPAITPPKDYSEVREDLLSRLRKIISGEWEGAGIDVYGSAGNGLAMESADVDMSLYMPKSFPNKNGHKGGLSEPPKVILARFAALMEQNNMTIQSKLLEARVPVIKMQDPITELHVDVCVNNILAVKNTELIKAYVDLDERFRYVCVLVKLWAKRRDLNDAYLGTLSSYAYTLLVIHYLQTLQPPVLPCLQQTVRGSPVENGELPSEMTDNGSGKLYNTYFDRTVTPEGFQSNNHTPVHELLLGFFQYYAYTFNYRTDLASIRLGKKAPRSLRSWDEQTVYREWEGKQAQYKAGMEAAKAALEEKRKAEAEERLKLKERMNNGEDVGKASDNLRTRPRVAFPRKPRLESKHLFCIEDPFDIDHDLSRGMEKGAVTVIRQEMMRAYELLAETGDFEATCEPWE